MFITECRNEGMQCNVSLGRQLRRHLPEEKIINRHSSTPKAREHTSRTAYKRIREGPNATDEADERQDVQDCTCGSAANVINLTRPACFIERADNSENGRFDERNVMTDRPHTTELRDK